MKWVIQLNHSDQNLFVDIEDGEVHWRASVEDAIGFYDRRSAEAFWDLLVFRGAVIQDDQVSVAAYARCELLAPENKGLFGTPSPVDLGMCE